MTKLITLLIVIILFFSCSKRNDIKSKPVSPKPDTLATGWSRALINDDFFVDIYFINDSIGYMAGTKESIDHLMEVKHGIKFPT